jgi:hypothetical protein
MTDDWHKGLISVQCLAFMRIQQMNAKIQFENLLERRDLGDHCVDGNTIPK